VATAVGWIAAAALVFSLASSLFGRKREVTIKAVEEGTDIFDGERSYIALRELNLIRSQFESSAELRSTPLDFTTPVSQIALYVTEQIPPEWEQRPWIRYYLSVDGESWSEVRPLSQTGDLQSQVYIPPAKVTSRVYFRAQFSRPADDVYRSPLLLHYALQGLSADGSL
jgi:hypothetical protein